MCLLYSCIVLLFTHEKEITDLTVYILEDLTKRLGELAPQFEKVTLLLDIVYTSILYLSK